MPKRTAEGEGCCAENTRATTYDLLFSFATFNTEGGLMEFSPTEAPVYGREILKVHLGPNSEGQEQPNDVQNGVVPLVSELDVLFLIFEGRRETHITTLKYIQDNIWLAPIPGHECAERVYLTVLQRNSPDLYDCVAEGEFHFQYDSAFFLAQFLINSVNNPNALDDLELIRTDDFDLSNEILSTLDGRLSTALKHISFPEGWHMLGGDTYDGGEHDCRETLLHLAGRLGLHDTAVFLLTKAGSEEALGVMNHEGQLPCAVAASNGFDRIHELFSGYNTNGMVTVEDEHLDTDSGIIRSHGNAGASLTTASGFDQNRTIASYIEVLRDMEATMKRGRSPGLRRQYQTDWPSPPLSTRQPHIQSFETLDGQSTTEARVAETMERIAQEQRAHTDALVNLLHDSDPAEDNTERENGERGSPSSGLDIPADVMMEARRQYGILEGSISSVAGINDGLFRLRGTLLLHKRHTEPQHLRRLSLSRFSSSCPSLDNQNRMCPLSPIHESDQHRSMQDLAKVLGPSPLAASPPSDDIANHAFLVAPDGASGDFDSTVRICVNGVTVDSSEDYSRGGSVKLRRPSRLSAPRDDDSRRRSWCPDSPSRGDCGDLNSTLQARGLSGSGKSISLSGLDREETSDDELVQGIEAGYQSPMHTGVRGHRHTSSLDSATERALSGGFRSPEGDNSFDSTDSCTSGKDVSDDQEVIQPVKAEMVMGSPNVAYSMSDLTSSQIVNGNQRSHVRSIAGMGGTNSYEEGCTMLGIPHSTMTKSLSTPSIPAATKAASAVQVRRGSKELREGKQISEPTQILLQKLVEDYDATFQRQDEIEEEEEDGHSGERKQLTLTDFLNEDSAAGDSDEKSRGSGLRKEEKKRKSSFFARTFQSYRDSTKKHKDKEKSKPSHRFVAVSISNATACNVCHKPMANKPALRCENCLINVHEHSCKEQVPNCEKNSNMKVLQREGSAPAAIVPDKSSSSISGSSLRPSHSFKLKDRSASAPGAVAKNQNLMASAASHRHSVPSSGKAISETDETDGSGHHELLPQTNITDTASESLESLDATPHIDISFLEDEPDLQLTVEEQEAWNVTVDKKTLKKMNAKDIKRQDTIWELVQTEKQYVKRLKIMQKLFRDRIMQRREFGLTFDQLERLFPRLDTLYEIHAGFLRALLKLQTKNADRSVDDIGAAILQQFGGATAERMKSAYGHFCSRHTEAIQMYKEIAKNDRQFQNFCRRTSNESICEKRELPDFILGVTVRLSKYPILIDAIFKNTRDKKDREQLKNALECSKKVVTGVDEEVAAYEKLMEIYRAFDNRTTVYMGKKFKRQDLIANNRRILHSGTIGWKTARSRVVETYTLVLTDIMVFLQKNDMKYSFFMQDNKSSVVPLCKLLVREKADVRDSHGIYVISQNKQDPEMYELVCRTQKDRDDWIKILKDAIQNCPEEEEVQPQTQLPPEMATEEERKRQEERAKKVQDIIEQLHQKDDIIRKMCEDKNQLMIELMDFSAFRDHAFSHPSSQHDLGGGTSVEMVQAAMQEASRLTTILQGPGTQLSRSVSSAGEHVSMSYVNMVMPKRAETFAGFDTSFEVPKSGAVLKKRFIQQYGDEEGRCPSELSLHGTETIPEDDVISTTDMTRPSSQPGLYPLPYSSASSLPHGPSQQAWEASTGEGDPVGLDHSDHGSGSELSAASVSSLNPARVQAPPSTEQMMSVVQLVKYLNNLMNLTSKQMTTVESLRAELAEAKEEISKLSQDMHGQRRTFLRHNQLEELRNLQENISRERQQWESAKERDQEAIRQEWAKIQAHRKMLENQEAELRSKKDDLRRDKEALQRQVDMMREQGLLRSSTLSGTQHVVDTVDLDLVDTDNSKSTTHSTPTGHRRSASADFNHNPGQQFYGSDLDPVLEAKGMPRRPRHSVSSLSSVNKSNVPPHLLSTRNEQRLGGSNVQPHNLPHKLSSNPSSISLPDQKSGSSGAAGGLHGQQQLPYKLASTSGGSGSHKQKQQSLPPHMLGGHPRTASLGSLGARPEGGYSPVHSTPTPRQAQGMITRNQHSRSAPSGLGLAMMKLAEPSKAKGSSPPAPSAAGGKGSNPGQPAPSHNDSSTDEVIYF